MQKIIFDKSDIIKAVIRLLIISVFCFITVFIFSCIVAFVLSRVNFSYDILLPVIAVILALSACIDGFLISRWYKENGLIWGILAGVVIIVFILMAALKFNTLALSGQLLTNAAVAVCAGAIGGITGVNIN